MTNEELFQKLQDGDKTARDTLILQNQPLVMIVIKQYPRRNDPIYSLDDLVSVGNLGLIKAVDTFDVTKGYKFSSYAVKCITNQLLRLYRKIQREVESFSLNATCKGSRNKTWADVIPYRGKRMEKCLEERDMVICGIHAIGKLEPLQRNVMTLYLRSDGKLTQEEMAKELGISQSYCSKVMSNARRNLQQLCEYDG